MAIFSSRENIGKIKSMRFSTSDCSHLLKTLLELSILCANYKFCMWKQHWVVLLDCREPDMMGNQLVGILLRPCLEYLLELYDSHTDTKSVFKERTLDISNFPKPTKGVLPIKCLSEESIEELKVSLCKIEWLVLRLENILHLGLQKRKKKDMTPFSCWCFSLTSYKKK